VTRPSPINCCDLVPAAGIAREHALSHSYKTQRLLHGGERQDVIRK
jgi:hypothetical protein